MLPGQRFRTAALALALTLLGGAVAAQASDEAMPGGRMTVTGLGEVTAVPDMARISLGVTQEADTAQDALDAMSVDMRAVLAAIEAAGLAALDVQTGALQLQPVQAYDRETGVATVTGYRAVTDVEVRVRDLDALGPVLDAVVVEGATQMSGLQFDVTDRAALLNAARRAAVADAQARAALYAQAAGVQLGAVMDLREASSESPPQPLMRLAMDQVEAGPPVAAGEMTIRAEVSMTWAIGE